MKKRSKIFFSFLLVSSIALLIASGLVLAKTKSSYAPVVIEEDFSKIVSKMKCELFSRNLLAGLADTNGN